MTYQVTRIALGLFASVALAAPAFAAGLFVEVAGIRSDEGRVYVAIHVEKEGVEFPDAAGMVAGGWTLAREGSFQIEFAGLPPGRYAVNSMHDENGNEELDTNLLGIPVEGYGFANDATGIFGPPGFDASSLELTDAGAAITINLGY